MPKTILEVRQLSKHFTPDDMQRIKTLAAQKDIPLPPTVEVIQPIDDTPEVGRKFIGVWISESGYDTSGRQYAIILTQVIAEGSADMRVIGNTCVGPPTSISPTTIPARCLPLIARIVDGKMTFKNALFETTGTLDLRHHLALEEVWTNGGRARVSLKPVWTLLEAERNANK